MTAFESAKHDDYRERQSKGEKLSDREQRDFNSLDAIARKEWENEPQPYWEGGHADMF